MKYLKLKKTVLLVPLLLTSSACSLIFDDRIDDYLKETESKPLEISFQFKTCYRFLSITRRISKKYREAL